MYPYRIRKLKNVRILSKPIKYCKQGYERSMRGICYKIKSNVLRERQVTKCNNTQLQQKLQSGSKSISPSLGGDC